MQIVQNRRLIKLYTKVLNVLDLMDAKLETA